MLISLNKFGGIMPIVLDPAALPDGKSQEAEDCRVDQGGLTSYQQDSLDSAPTLTGAIETIFRYYDLNTGGLYFFAWNSDVDAVTAPQPNDIYSRVYYTEGGIFKVTDSTLFNQGGTNYPEAFRYPSPPAPLNACVVAGTPSGSPPTSEETRAYVYTYVNGYGSEGPPSPASNLLDIYDGNLVEITGMDIGPVDPGSLYNILYKNIYRTNQNSTGTAEYQFVDFMAVAAATYSDRIADANLGEVLPSLEWDGPPTGIEGLIALPNGVLAGFTGNTVCFSVPYYPHAWPVSWQQTADRPVVGLGAYGSTVVVLTEGQPYLTVGNDPSNMVMEKMDIGFSCMSKRGIIYTGDLVVYPSPEGLVVVGPQVREVVTQKIMTRDQWILNYNPSTIFAYYWEAKYIGFYTANGYTGAFVYDFKTGEFLDLDVYALAGYYDKTVGLLFLVIGGNIVAFCNSSGSTRSYNYLSKQYKYRKTAFTCGKALAASYPVYLDIIYPDIPFTIALTVNDDEPFRFPGLLTETMNLRLTGTAGVYGVFLAGAIEELPL
jgi:hypothetical protein